MRITFDGGDDHDFRSNLERDVARELDAHGVQWRYEVAVTLPDGRPVRRYLPDFTIDEAIHELQLPAWVECKPQQMLYELRDALGVTRRAGEYFQTDVHVEGVDGATMRSRGFDELWKPKALAELTGLAVLIVGGVQGTNKLTVEMRPDEIVFSRTHPFANWRGYLRAIERERAQIEHERRMAEWRRQDAERAAKMARERADRATRLTDFVRRTVAAHTRYTPRFASTCIRCDAYGDTGGLYRVRLSDLHERWVRICPACEQA